MTGNAILWMVWVLASVLTAGTLYTFLFIKGPQDAFAIGEVTNAHAQIETSCGSCHTAPFFASEVKASKAMNKACLSCHEDELDLSNDSHPVKKFRGPAKIAIREKLDGLYCATCHMEHAPEITGPMMVTLPGDLCSACHQEVGNDRPSHEGLGFETCASAGCHNFHDNTALYEKFLVEHSGHLDFAENAISELAASKREPSPIKSALARDVPAQALEAYLSALEDPPEDPAIAARTKIDAVLYASDAVAPDAYLDDVAISNWAASEHAREGINCAGCHAAGVAETDDLAQIETAWIEAPTPDVCADCHAPQAKSFSSGKHGMRAHPELAAPREGATDGIVAYLSSLAQEPELGPFRVGESRLPMQSQAHEEVLGSCSNCHKPHEQDLRVAAVEACTSCHADDHSLAYADSPHHDLWLAELDGTAPVGSGVSCADCHMPKIEDRRAGVVTTHNQNAYLKPNEKMIRPVCMSCHSLEFSIDALADPNLVKSNFNGRPSAHIESVDWALRRVEGAK